MVPEREVDPAVLYEQERHAFVALLRGRSAQELATTVSATPAWTVHDVLSHVVGITADLNAQRFGSGDSDAWTAGQIAARRVASIDELAAEWDREGPQFESGLRLFGYQFGAHYLGDLLQHVGDVHVTLGLVPARDDLALAVALDFYLAAFEQTLAARGVGAVGVAVSDGDGDGDEHWHLGEGTVRATVTAPRWDLFRALGGRRTLGEIGALRWSGDRDVIAPLVSQYPAPASPLHEPTVPDRP